MAVRTHCLLCKQSELVINMNLFLIKSNCAAGLQFGDSVLKETQCNRIYKFVKLNSLDVQLNN